MKKEKMETLFEVRRMTVVHAKLPNGTGHPLQENREWLKDITTAAYLDAALHHDRASKLLVAVCCKMAPLKIGDAEFQAWVERARAAMELVTGAQWLAAQYRSPAAEKDLAERCLASEREKWFIRTGRDLAKTWTAKRE